MLIICQVVLCTVDLLAGLHTMGSVALGSADLLGGLQTIALAATNLLGSL